MQKVSILGATGSIGRSTLDVIARHPDRFQAYALTANHNVALLAELCAQFSPRFACIADQALASELSHSLEKIGATTQVLAGEAGLEQVASLPEVDSVMAAIVGSAGLKATLAAARSGKRVLLANKEALVMAGPIFMQMVREHGATLLPIDSEHNAIFQCLPPDSRGRLAAHGVRRILLTGSGGPFLNRPLTDLHAVSPDEACAHPNWVMGRKISVDSATMMNKALEVIEAHWLFGAAGNQIEVVIHPQSVIHSMVEYADGSVIAQLGNPDMRTPIAQGLAYPERIESGVTPLEFSMLGALNFRKPDFERFPALRLAYSVLEKDDTTSTVFNASNEIAVAAFLAGRLPFTRITAVIEETLGAIGGEPAQSLATIIDADSRARSRASVLVSAMSQRSAA
jgi:1-deoxy-D-xylulose-5-phosphate reductoisomerase